MSNCNESLLTQEHESISKIINESGCAIINVSFSENSPVELSFTIGLAQTHNISEVVFLKESPEYVKNIVQKILTFSSMGFSLNDIISFTKIEDKDLKVGAVPILAQELFMPQLKSYYQDFLKLENYEMHWIGKADQAYPFSSFLNDEELPLILGVDQHNAH